ncbi:Axonemal dynein light chain domain containing 1 [Podarcis lilfordi]|uniref:Axonemal dynein light chain domain containing 1 n=1 Tax=Podarcis lilfordi TaxID=74358 RepID=A0AA35P8U9_9SAUR|nr:Axonemal dynein light chain domain containing 1 [Podarcis lilfordi]
MKAGSAWRKFWAEAASGLSGAERDACQRRAVPMATDAAGKRAERGQRGRHAAGGLSLRQPRGHEPSAEFYREKQENKKLKDASSLVSVSKDSNELPQLRDKSAALDSSKPLPTSLQRDFIPEEIFVALTSAANPIPCPSVLRPPKKTKSIKDFQGCIRTTDGVWQHPVRRNKFRYLIEHPICLTGAGREMPIKYVTQEWLTRDPASSAEPNHSSPREAAYVAQHSASWLCFTLGDRGNHEGVCLPLRTTTTMISLLLARVLNCSLTESASPLPLPSLHLALCPIHVSEYQSPGNNNMRGLLIEGGKEDPGKNAVITKTQSGFLKNLVPALRRASCRPLPALDSLQRQPAKGLSKYIFKNAQEQLPKQGTKNGEKRLALQNTKQPLTQALHAVNFIPVVHNCSHRFYRFILSVPFQHLNMSSNACLNVSVALSLGLADQKKRLSHAGHMTWKLRPRLDLMLSADVTDLSTLQELTQEFRERVNQIGTELEQIEETSRDRARSIQNGLAGWLSYFQNHVLGKGTYTFAKGASLLDQILVDLKVWEKMLNEELAQFGGEILLLRQEPLTVTTNLQKQWVDLGLVVHGRHKTFKGRMPVELKMLERINKQSTLLCEQYRIRICGDNGTPKLDPPVVLGLQFPSSLTTVLHPLKWKLYFQLDQCVEFYSQLRIWGFFQPILIMILEDVFKKIQQWILTTTSGSEKENDQFSHELTDFHYALSKWMVNLLIHMAPDHISHDTLPLTDAEAARQAERKLLNIFKLEGEATGLAAKLSTFSCYIVSCCKEMVATITRQKMVTLQPDAEHELQQLGRIKTEFLDWIETCNLLLSGMKTTPTTLISQEDLVGLFGLEVLQLKRQLPPRPEQRVESSSTTDVPVEEEKKDKEAVDVLKDQEAAEQKQALEAEEQPPVPSTSTGEQAGSLAVTYPVRYIGDDSNVYVKTMQVQEITVSRRELHASQWTTKASKKEFELLASLEILEERLVEAKKRAQQAEEKSEVLHEDLEEALAKIQNMEGEQPKLKDSEQKETKLKAEVVVKEQTESPSQPSTPKP